MERDNERLFVLARRAYELSRLHAASKVLLFVAPMVALALLTNESDATTVLVVGGVLSILAVGFSFRGQAYGRAVGPGLIAGVIPLLLPWVARFGGNCCVDGSCSSTCMVACVCGGLFAGVIVGMGAAGQTRSPISFALAASAICGVAGMLGCLHMGVGGVAGMLAALLASTAPVMVVARVRR